jgi:peptide/nickel transport system substrate-binding protein
VKEVVKEVVVEKPVVREVVKEVIVRVPEREVEEKVLNVRMCCMAPNYSPHVVLHGDAAVNMVGFMFSTLVVSDPINQVWAPDLAQSWDISPDATKYTFHLRPNALWHDGEPVTAHDVKWSFESYVGVPLSRHGSVLSMIKGAAEYRAGEAMEVKGITVLDDHTVEFEMAFPSAVFLDAINTVSGGLAPLPILPMHLLKDISVDDITTHDFFVNELVGSGPFKFVKWEQEQFLEMEANDEYYFGRPRIDRLIMHNIPTAEATQIAMQRGEIDVVMRGSFPLDAIPSFYQDPRYDIVTTQGGVLLVWFWNSRMPDLVDGRIRQAVIHAIDRQKLIDVFYGGNAQISNTFMIQSWIGLEIGEAPLEYNPEKARELLAAANWDPNRVLKVMKGTPRDEKGRAEAAAIQQYLADVGIKMEWRFVKGAEEIKSFYETFDYDVDLGGWGVYGDPDSYLNAFLTSTGDNPTGYPDAEWDARVKAASQETDIVKRGALYRALNDDIIRDLPVAGMWMSNQIRVLSRCFIMPAFAGNPQVTSLADAQTYPIFKGRDDHWIYRPDQWDLVC